MSIHNIEFEGLTVPVEVVRDAGDGVYTFKVRATTEFLQVSDKQKLGNLLGKAFTQAIEMHLKAQN